MRVKITKYTTEFKMKIVLEVLKGENTLIDDYNHYRPHAVLGKLSHIEYFKKYNLKMSYSVLAWLV